MTSQNQLNEFVQWVQQYNHLLLQNEDDVETKFILPFFELLGYKQSHRRGKYPLKVYNPGRQGRKPEIDQIYFITDKLEEQKPHTALIIVEAKEPQEADLRDAVEQARFYAFYLKPLLLVITNGYNLKILRVRRYQDEEVVFDGTVLDLGAFEQAERIYRQINFITVSHQKEQISNERRYAQYVLLEEALRQDPQLQSLLEEGDFPSYVIRQGRKVIVSRPKVTIECTLPLALSDGLYEIEFSSLSRRSLTIQVQHDEILKYLILGIGTPPNGKGRKFLTQVKQDIFELELGQVKTLLSKEEVVDLCACVDVASQEYKNALTQYEELLETLNYTPAKIPNFFGFYLFSVKSWLWNLMVRFAHEFDWDNGKSEWHIFERYGTIIRVANRRHDHAFLHPKIANGFWSVVPDDYVEIIYEVPNEHLDFVETSLGSWKERVGPLEIWTARYTHHWLLDKFIPKVISYYTKDFKKYSSNSSDLIIDHHNNNYPNLDNFSDIKLLNPYLEDVQNWLYRHVSSVLPAQDMRDFYGCFTNIIRRCDPLTLDLHYMMSKLSVVQSRQAKEEVTFPNWSGANTKAQHQMIVQQLDNQVSRINQTDYETSYNADLISRVFTVALRDGVCNCSQAEINAAKTALMPLWARSRFEMRYIASFWPIFPWE